MKMLLLPESRRGFTLAEILVVLAIAAVLTGLVVPAMGVLRGTAVTQGARALAAELNSARQTALTRNRKVQVRFYLVNSSCRGLQTFLVDEIGRAKPLSKLIQLSEQVEIVVQPAFSTVISSTNPAPPVTGRQDVPEFGSNIEYAGFHYLPDGSTDLDPNGSSGQEREPWCLTIAQRKPAVTVEAPPRNFITLQIDPVIGKIQAFQP